jgi:hypothetical protein
MAAPLISTKARRIDSSVFTIDPTRPRFPYKPSAAQLVAYSPPERPVFRSRFLWSTCSNSCALKASIALRDGIHDVPLDPALATDLRALWGGSAPAACASLNSLFVHSSGSFAIRALSGWRRRQNRPPRSPGTRPGVGAFPRENQPP